MIFIYDRKKALDYARKWALERNPAYYDFENLGGDCTNFVSQCIYAGCGEMNYTKDIGWYYNSSWDRAAAWTSAEYLYRFLVGNNNVGPKGVIASLPKCEVGDIIQLHDGNRFYHSLIIVAADPIRIAAHSVDAYGAKLDEYEYVGAVGIKLSV